MTSVFLALFAVASILATFAGLIFVARLFAMLSDTKEKGNGKVLWISVLAALGFAVLALWFAGSCWVGVP
jgi:hypothetical protein